MSTQQHEESTMQSVEDSAGTPPTDGTAKGNRALDEATDAERRVAAGIREGLDIDMRDVKEGVLRMGSYVEDQILAAHDAIMNRDAQLAQKVIASDARINDVQRAVSGVVTMTIATQQPVARDLRFLLALDRVTYELERIGDHAGSVAKQARKLAGVTIMVTYDELTPMATLAAQQVRDVVLALIDIDEKVAREVAARDDEIDRLYHKVFDDVLAEMRTDPAKVDPGTRILFAAHYLERIGDRVTNIAEDVVFLATGEVEDLNP
ncbi:MAG: phosphate signaling complex protein PhoU [Candidatus Limnocylindrales bacterium]|jgi:phosphate transport system protein